MRKRILSIGLCLGLGVAMTACGTGGRSFREQSVTVMQVTGSAQDQQETKDAQDERSTGNAQDRQETTGTQAYEALKEQILAQMSDEEKNWMGGLSKEQRLADFESLCDGLREHYPYAGSAKQQIGADLDALDNPLSHKTYASMAKYYQDVDCRMEEKRAGGTVQSYVMGVGRQNRFNKRYFVQKHA